MIASMRETFAPLDEAAIGYRTQLIADGWTHPVAEQMAAQFYTLQVATIMQGMANAHEQHRRAGVAARAIPVALTIVAILLVLAGLTGRLG